MGSEVEKTEVARYLPHAVVATALVAVLPLYLSLVLVDSTLGSLALSITLSLLIGNVCSALWQRTEGSSDLVFEDLMLWGYFHKLRAQRRTARKIEKIKLALSEEASLSRADQVALLKRLALTLEKGDRYTHGHSERVSRHAYMTAKQMRLPRRRCEKIQLAGLLHDIGKLMVPREVLHKPDRLTDHEFDLIKSHPAVGAEIVERLGDLELTAMVRYHHERVDGGGYPERRTAAQIPLGARIIAVADTFDAITSRRPYRPAQTHRTAIDIIEREAGTQLDQDVVKAFLAYYSGRRSLSRFFFFTTGFKEAVEFAFVGLQRIGIAGVANAAVVGTTTVAIAGGGMIHGSRIDQEARARARHRAATVEKRDADRKKPATADAPTPATQVAGEMITRRTGTASSGDRKVSTRRSSTTRAREEAASTIAENSHGEGADKAAENSSENRPEEQATSPVAAAVDEAIATKAKGKGPGENDVEEVTDRASRIPETSADQDPGGGRSKQDADDAVDPTDLYV